MTYRERFKLMQLLKNFQKWCLTLPSNYNALRWDVMSIAYCTENNYRLCEIDPADVTDIENLSLFHRDLMFEVGIMANKIGMSLFDEKRKLDKDRLYKLDIAFLSLEKHRKKHNPIDDEVADFFSKDMAELFNRYCDFYTMQSLIKTSSDYALLEVASSIVSNCAESKDAYDVDLDDPRYQVYKTDPVTCEEIILSGLERMRQHAENVLDDILSADLSDYTSDLSDIVDMSDYYCFLDQVIEEFSYITATAYENLAELEDN